MNSVKKIIDQWDPIGLFPHSPDDEYQFEILEIEKLISEPKDSETLAKEIYCIFKKAFDSVFDKTLEQCLEISNCILNTRIKGG